jgi:hypothetical protein
VLRIDTETLRFWPTVIVDALTDAIRRKPCAKVVEFVVGCTAEEIEDVVGDVLGLDTAGCEVSTTRPIVPTIRTMTTTTTIAVFPIPLRRDIKLVLLGWFFINSFVQRQE